MDLSLATSIYERAKVVKNNKIAAQAEKVIEEYSAFQKNNPDLPTIAPFCELDYNGLLRLLTHHGEEKIDTIIEALDPLIPKFNDEECLKGKASIQSRVFKEPVVVKFYDEKKLSSLLDTFLKVTNYKEMEWIEFKTDFLRRETDYLGKLFSSLSNAACLKNVQYAYLIYGVKESKREINGTKFSTASKIWQTIEDELRQKCVPNLNFEIIEFNYKENRQQHIIIFKIQAAGAKPIAYCGKSFIRQDDKVIPLEDFPNLLKKLSNPKQQPIIDNSISVILQSPQFFFLIDPKNVNTPFNNPKKTTEDSNNKSKKIDIKRIVKIIIKIIIGILFGTGATGLFVKSCISYEKKSIEINASANEQNNSHNQSPIVYGDHATLNYNLCNDSKENISNTKESTILSSHSINEDSYSSSSKTTGEVVDKKKTELEQTACLLYREAMRINPDANHVIGNLKSLVFNYNKFAKKIKYDTVEHKGKFHEQPYGLGSIGDSSSHMLPFIIFNVENFLKVNNINCD